MSTEHFTELTQDDLLKLAQAQYRILEIQVQEINRLGKRCWDLQQQVIQLAPKPSEDRKCNRELHILGVAYPRTCAYCGLGPCQKFTVQGTPVCKKL